MAAVGPGIERAVHSDFIVHWTGKDIDEEEGANWYEAEHQPRTKKVATERYLERLIKPLPFEQDTIVDFKDDVDQLTFFGEHLGYESVAEVLADASSGNVVITLSKYANPPTIVILGIDDPRQLANESPLSCADVATAG